MQKIQASQLTKITRCLAVITVLAAGQAWGEDELESRRMAGLQNIHAEGSFQLECWQEGKRIFYQTGLQGMTLGKLLGGNTISFRKSKTGGASVVLIPFERSLCITVSE